MRRRLRLAALAALISFPAALVFAGPGHGGGGSRSGGSHGGSSHGGGSGGGSHGGGTCGSGSHGGSHGGSHDGGSHHGRGGRTPVVVEGPSPVGGGIWVEGGYGPEGPYGPEPYGPGPGYWPGYGGVYVQPFDWASVDMDITPQDARVYLEGRYIGAATDFHGNPDYLFLRPGPYKLEFRLDGFEPLSVDLDVVPNADIKIHQELHEIAGARRRDMGPRPMPKGGLLRYWGKFRGELEAYDGDPRDRRSAREPDRPGRNDGDRAEPPSPSPPPEEGPPAAPGSTEARHGKGRLVFSVEPDDAAVYMDGRFLGLGEELGGPDGVAVRAGKHKLTVLRPGFRARELEVEIVEGETTRIEVSLRR